MSSAGHKFGVALAMLMLTLLALDAARHGIADVWALEGRYQAEAWYQSPTKQPLWSEAFEDLHTALALDPDNPSLMEDMGSLYDRRAVQFDAQPQRQALERESLAYFRSAAMHRPVSPYVWSNIALVKFQLGELDPEFLAALTHAASLGPWEPHVQLTVANIGLGAWDRLGTEERAAVSAQIHRAASTDKPGLTSLLLHAQRQNVVCMLSEIRVVLPDIHCS